MKKCTNLPSVYVQKVAPARRNSAKEWLQIEKQFDVLELILALEVVFKYRGSTRRNWWDILAGTEDWKHCTVYECEFPIFGEARHRKGWSSTEDRKDPPSWKRKARVR